MTVGSLIMTISVLMMEMNHKLSGVPMYVLEPFFISSFAIHSWESQITVV
jgi:hypothetical protein